MWHRLAVFVLRFRVLLTVLLLLATGVMGYYARQVQLSYEFSRAIPTDNPKYRDYQRFLKQFGEEGNLLVVGVQTDKFFQPGFFYPYQQLASRLSHMPGIQHVLSVPTAVNLEKDSATGQLKANPIFKGIVTPEPPTVEEQLQGDVSTFLNLPFYKGFLYNPDTHAYLMAIAINKDIMSTKRRTVVVDDIVRACDSFARAHQVDFHYSGLPLVRTVLATKVQRELKLFLLMSFLLSAAILALFFRSAVAVVASMLVVGIGVVWSLGTIVLCGYKITLLTGLIPPLIVVIGIPNCVYFLNKYHSEYGRHGDKRQALLSMVERMGIVTLFTNLTAAIGFGVFFFTRSAVLKEFGLVAGLNLLAIFIISLILLPALFSFLPAPNRRHTKYLDTGWMMRLLDALARWVFGHRKWIYTVTAVACMAAAAGILRLRSVGYIVDDLPKSDVVYQDLKFFERHFHGVMPLEIVVDARKKYLATAPRTLVKIDSLHEYLKRFPEIGHTLVITEGIKFAAQAYMGGDSVSYALPPDAMLASVGATLRNRRPDRATGNAPPGKYNAMKQLLYAFIDSNGQQTRISVTMADVGSVRLPLLLDSIRQETNRLFDTARYTVTFTGTSIVFLEGSRFIINSLRDSLLLAFAMILGCMIFLFRSWRIVLISILVNIVPLLLTAGTMGWLGIPLKPSTVLVFSVALGITVDVTIRFLVNFKQELVMHDDDIPNTVRRSIHDTGLSIIYTSLILIAGFAVFLLSQFDGTRSLGFLTSLTLLLAMITNLTLQPALLLSMDLARERRQTKRQRRDEAAKEP